jgi:hypothetical protein
MSTWHCDFDIFFPKKYKETFRMKISIHRIIVKGMKNLVVILRIKLETAFIGFRTPHLESLPF